MPEKGKDSRRAASRLKQRLPAALRAARYLGAAALAGLAVWGSGEIRHRVEAEPRFDLSLWRIGLGELPAWAPPELSDELAELRLAESLQSGTGEERLTVFTPGLLEKIKAQLLTCAWIRDVPRLALRCPGFPDRRQPAGASLDPPGSGSIPNAAEPDGDWSGAVELVLDLRVPIAAVAAGGRFYLVDREGVRVGPPYAAERIEAMGLASIVGGEVRGPRRPPPPGAAWEDRDVREGLEVARILQEARVAEEFPDAPIRTIEIHNVGQRARPGDCEIVLSAGDLRLGWGRSPISSGARTLSVPEILQNLRRVLRNRDRLPRGALVLLYTSPLVAERSSL